MLGLRSLVSIFLCGFIFKELSSICAYGQYPYPGVFYPPPPPFGSSSVYPQAPYPFPFLPPYYESTCYAGPPSTLPQTPSQRGINSKPRIVKPFRVQPSNTGPVIVGRGDSNTPIIISSRTSRTAHQQPTLLSPFTNLIHTFLKSLAPRTCDCDGDGEYRR